MISVFDLFKIGIGPSSSHTVGPMRAAHDFSAGLRQSNQLPQVARVHVELFGSLGATGHGHGTVKAVVAGLSGNLPDLVDPEEVRALEEEVGESLQLWLAGVHLIDFNLHVDIVLHRRKTLPFHANGMTFAAFDGNDAIVVERTFYSIGGGFVVEHGDDGAKIVEDPKPVPYYFDTGAQMLAICNETGLSISDIMLANEVSRRGELEVRAEILHIWEVMQACVETGMRTDGTLPGGLKVRRRAMAQHAQLRDDFESNDALHAMEWVTMFALAVNEENAAGGRVVTAPTNGAAGIIPAVLHYYAKFIRGANDDGIVRFFLAATAVGWLFKKNASISGAEVGCQGEVGSACSMAAAGLAEILGGSPEQVENAAEIGIEHNLGLTCDPVGGLVQIPCIERNAIAAIKAITAARMAVRGDGKHHVTLDSAIKTMRETGEDMKVKYKETARGGLALNVVEC
jgi:L-serine dehydratase